MAVLTTVIELLKVPVTSTGVAAGVTTDGSKVTCRSYETTPKPVKSPKVTGTTMVPGVAVTFGSDTPAEPEPIVVTGAVPETSPLSTLAVMGKLAQGPGGLIVVPVVPVPCPVLAT